MFYQWRNKNGVNKIKNIEKCYTKDIPVIKNLDLEISEGEFAVIVGPSGCGKSTLLRLIAGLEEVTNGEIYIANKESLLLCQRIEIFQWFFKTMLYILK